MLAAWRAGLTPVMLSMLWRRRELGMAADLLEPKALLGVGRFAGGHMSEMLCDIAVNQLSIRYVYVVLSGETAPDRHACGCFGGVRRCKNVCRFSDEYSRWHTVIR